MVVFSKFCPTIMRHFWLLKRQNSDPTVILILLLQKNTLINQFYLPKSFIVFDLSILLYLILYYVIFTFAVLSLLIIKYFLSILHQVLNSSIALIRFNFYL